LVVGEGDYLFASTGKQRIRDDDESIVALLRQRSKRRIDIPFAGRVEDVHRLSKGARRLLHFLGVWIQTLGIYEHGDLASLRQQFAQQLQALRTKRDGEKRHARQIAARAAEIADKAVTHRISAYREYDRNGCRRGFGGDGRNVTSSGNEDRRPARHEFGSQCGETIELTFGPTVIDPHVLAIDIAYLGETMPERRHHG
jgi:hypothetical protein